MKHEVGLQIMAGIVIVALACGIGTGLNYAKCNDVSVKTGKPTNWSIISGCYVKVNGKWVPQSSWRGEQE